MMVLLGQHYYRMEHLTINEILLAGLGFIVRWLLHLNSARQKVIVKRGDVFDWGFYFTDNGVMIVLSFCATIALLLLIPTLLESGEMLHVWSPLVAMGCGMSNVEIVEIIKKQVLDKLNK